MFGPACLNLSKSAALTMNQWVGQKQRPTQFGDRKLMPGKESYTTTDRSSDYFKAGTHNPVSMVPPLEIEESDNVPCDETSENDRLLAQEWGPEEPATTPSPTDELIGDFDVPQAS